MARRNMTDPDDRRALSETQLTAIELLVAGRNLTAAAEALGVARQTVSAWVNKDAEFRAALNRRRQELRAELHDHLRALAPAAAEALEQELRGPNRLQAAVHLLRAAGLYGGPRAEGPTEAGEIRAEDARRDLLVSLSPF
jgi:hypothetical protein